MVNWVKPVLNKEELLTILVKIVQLNNTKFVKKIYSLMYRNIDNNPAHMSWARNVKTLLQSIGLYEARVNQGVGNVNVFISLVKQRVFICLYRIGILI